MTDETPAPNSSRRAFLKVAGTVAATTVAASAAGTVACTTAEQDTAKGGEAGARRPRAIMLDRTTLDAVGAVVLPSVLGPAGRTAAIDAFVTWVREYDPVAEEMHGYGYADVRYLPPDPAPAWQAQLEGLDLLARRTGRKTFASCDSAVRLELLTTALASARGTRLPDPLGADHVAVALLAHWAGSSAARDVAFGAQIGADSCRQLEGVERRPLPLATSGPAGAVSGQAPGGAA